MKIWAWLLVLATVLSFLKVFAPISDSLDTILSWVALAITLAYLCAYWWENRHSEQKPASGAAISSSDQT